MTLFSIAWILLAPYAVAGLVAASPSANHLVARHLRPAQALGWTGLALLVAGAFTGGGAAGRAAILVGAPLAGLTFWSLGAAGRGRDDDPPSDPLPPDDPLPPGEKVDWDAFMRDLQRWSDQRGQEPPARRMREPRPDRRAPRPDPERG